MVLGSSDGLLALTVSMTLESEAIATVESEATQTDWLGDLVARQTLWQDS